MEGRTAVRPNRTPPRRLGPRARPSMEGRTAVRPNRHVAGAAQPDRDLPSMEGRTAVRPNVHGSVTTRSCRCPFNGGPDSCPAKLRQDSATGRDGVGRPSMEGRTAVRPNPARGQSPPGGPRSFNGGPDSCPAKPGQRQARLPHASGLQWRAGQLSGQTVLSTAGGRVSPHPSMEGRTAVRPNLRHQHEVPIPLRPSMEGRTAVRPNPSPWHRAAVAASPSMEGRTAVRPN